MFDFIQGWLAWIMDGVNSGAKGFGEILPSFQKKKWTTQYVM